MKTCHSEYGRIKSLLLSPATNSLQSQEKINQEWKSLFYSEAINFQSALKEYTDFQELVSRGAKLHLLPQSHASIDAIYCRDASLTTDYGVIICNMGKPARNLEPEAQLSHFKSEGIEVLGQIESPGTLEGGDMCWLDEKTLVVGHTYRSNLEGISQLKNFLEPKGVEIIVVDLPHYKGENDVFHIMSIISPIDKKLAVIYSPLMPISFRKELLTRGFEFVECPAEEFESMGCNVLAIAPREVVINTDNPITKQRLEAAGCTVHTYQGFEISKKGEGGPTCLTRPIYREI